MRMHLVTGGGYMASAPESADQRLLVALRHPMRRQVLRHLQDRGPYSPRQISDDLDEPLSNVSYHVRVLEEYGAVELVDPEPVRGSMQRFYKVSIDEDWALAALDAERPRPV
jgi:DNA-binding transcriptional ArsR family regulator